MSETYDLKEKYDVIVIGTGLSQMLISAACSQIGKTVLVLDKDSEYGQINKTLRYKDFDKWHEKLSYQKLFSPCSDYKDKNNRHKNEFKHKNAGEIEIKEHNPFSRCFNSFINKSFKEKYNKKFYDQFKIEDKFLFDLSPKILFSAGKLVNYVKSSAVKYCEFIPVNDHYICKRTFKNGKNIPNFLKIPVGKSELFNNTKLTPREKINLSKFLRKFDFEGNENTLNFFENFYNYPSKFMDSMEKPINDFMVKHSIPEKIRDFFYYGIAFLDDVELDENSSTFASPKNACSLVIPKITLFLRSMGIYNEGAMIYPLYGNGELPQAFSRVSAVHNGTFVLKCPVESIKTKNSNFCAEGVRLKNGQFIKCDKVLLDSTHLPEEFLLNCKQNRKILRAVCVTNKPLISNKNVFVASIKPLKFDNPNSVTIIQCDSSSNVCPDHYYVVYLSTLDSGEGTEESLDKVINELFFVECLEFDKTSNIERPKLLYCAMYKQTEVRADLEKFYGKESDSEKNENEEERNVFVVDNSDADICYEKTCIYARSVFNEMFPDKEFLQNKMFSIESSVREEEIKRYIEKFDTTLEESSDMDFFNDEQ